MDKLKKVIKAIEEIDNSLAKKTQERLDNLTKPQGSLGRLEEIAKAVVQATGRENPCFKNKAIITMAADHGVANEGVSAFPQEVTEQMVYNFIRGGAGINVLARYVGARVVVVDMGVAKKIQIPNAKIQNFKDKKINFGTKNIIKEPAMTKKEAVRSIESGIEVLEEEFEKGLDIVGTGDMGIGNTTASSAIAACITGKSVEALTGRGTGINDKALVTKIQVIKRALSINNPDLENPLDILAKVGGFEIGGLAGVILAGASRKIPVVIDGFISGAAALIAYGLQPRVKNYMIASHCSQEKGHRVILEYMGLNPILDLNLRLGEGTGAALAMNIVEASVKILTEMATFKSASVSERSDK